MAEEADVVIAWGHGPVPDAAKSAFTRPTKFLTLPNPDKWSEAIAPYGGVQGILAKFAPGVTPLRVACLGFSASCQGVAQLLAGPDAANLDAAVAIDGLHVGYSDKQNHVVNATSMQPWVAYAGRALNNLCLFVDTHSSIVPPGYASTTETANYLWEKVTSNTQDFVEDPPLPGLPVAPTSVHVSAGPATGPDRTVQYPAPAWNQKRRARGLIVLGCDNLDVPRGTADHIYQAKVILPLVLRQLLARRWNEIDPKQAGATCFLGRPQSSLRWLAEPPKCAKSVILPADFMTREVTNKAATSFAPILLGGLVVAGIAALALLPRAALGENPRGVPTWKLAGTTADRGRGTADLRRRGDKFRWYDASNGKTVGPIHASREAALEYAEVRGWHVRSAGSLGRWEASDVRATARELAREGKGYLGGSPSKIYVSDVIAALPGLTKDRLLTMHQLGEIELSRLDLTAAALESGEGAKVRESEIDWGNAQFHLIRVP